MAFFPVFKQRTFKLDDTPITIQEESERSLRSCVGEIVREQIPFIHTQAQHSDFISKDECLSFFIGSKDMKPVFKDKNVLELGMYLLPTSMMSRYFLSDAVNRLQTVALVS